MYFCYLICISNFEKLPISYFNNLIRIILKIEATWTVINIKSKMCLHNGNRYFWICSENSLFGFVHIHCVKHRVNLMHWITKLEVINAFRISLGQRTQTAHTRGTLKWWLLNRYESFFHCIQTLRFKLYAILSQAEFQHVQDDLSTGCDFFSRTCGLLPKFISPLLVSTWYRYFLSSLPFIIFAILRPGFQFL